MTRWCWLAVSLGLAGCSQKDCPNPPTPCTVTFELQIATDPSFDQTDLAAYRLTFYEDGIAPQICVFTTPFDDSFAITCETGNFAFDTSPPVAATCEGHVDVTGAHASCEAYSVFPQRLLFRRNVTTTPTKLSIQLDTATREGTPVPVSLEAGSYDPDGKQCTSCAGVFPVVPIDQLLAATSGAAGAGGVGGAGGSGGSE